MSALVSRHLAFGHGADAVVPESPAALAQVRTFHTLDALRGVAALAIVLFHAAFFLGMTPPAEGHIAVDLFFVMSGFIIAYRYDGELRSGMRLGAFVRVRLVRLYPLYLLGAMLGVLPAVAAVAAGEADWFHTGLVASFPLHVLMLPSGLVLPRIEELYPLNYVAWSLVLEILVNVAYAASARWWTARRLVVLVAIAFVGLCICDAHYGGLKYGYAWPHWPCGVARILYAFPMGVLLYRLFERKAVAIRVPWWSLLLAVVALTYIQPPVGKAIWELMAVTSIVPLIVMAAVVNEPPKAARGACAMAGILSYVVYSLHAPFVSLFIEGEKRLHVDLQSQTFGKGLAFATLLLALCVCAHRLYDKPLRRALSRPPRDGSRPSDLRGAVKN